MFDVFVVGGVPSTTYNPRDQRQLAEHLRNIRDGRHTMGAVHGPTKCGKSVLIAKTLPGATKIDGVNLTSVDAFWLQLASKLGISADERSSFHYTESGEVTGGGEAGVSVLRVRGEASDATSIARGREWTTPRSVEDRVVDRLREQQGVVVIDDFHHAPAQVRHDLVRVMKGVLFAGVPIVLASLSHRAYDAVLEEPEMEGRVQMIDVPTWDVDELGLIARDGFSSLNVEVDYRVIERLSQEALGSPQLMQLFCLEFCLGEGIRATQPTDTYLDEPDWASLFGGIAQRSPSVRKLRPIKVGPMERGHPRFRMRTRDGQEVDIYGAILLAVSHCGPVSMIPYRDLREGISAVLAGDTPSATQIKNTLSRQSSIAERLAADTEFADPVLHWDGETLFVVDPFFSFFVRWSKLGVDRS